MTLSWAVAATWMLFDIHHRLAAKTEQELEARQAHEDKVRALTRRLVGVASHRVLEQDGLEGRMADIIARQVELETRQASLGSLMEQALNWASSGEPSQRLESSIGPRRADPVKDVEQARSTDSPDEIPTLRLGEPTSHSNGAAPNNHRTHPGEPTGFLGPLRSSPPPGQAPRPRSDLTLKEQFALLESGMGRVEAAQFHTVEELPRRTQSQVTLIRTGLRDIGLSPDQVAPYVFKANLGLDEWRPSARPHHRLAFEARLAAARRSVEVLRSLRPVTESLPLRSPVEGENNLTSNFGPRSDPFTGAKRMHAGMDFRGAIGAPVRATGGGRVVTAEVKGGYGNLVELDHGNGIATRYGHLSEIRVEQGQTVTPGSVVGLLGSTGRSTGPHLHYETRISGGAVDPLRFLKVGVGLSGQTERQVPSLEVSAAPDLEVTDE